MQLFAFPHACDVAKATAADLQCCAHSAAVLFVTQTQIVECTYVKDFRSGFALLASEQRPHERTCSGLFDVSVDARLAAATAAAAAADP